MSTAYSEHYSIRDYEAWKGDWELVYGKPYAMTPSPGVSHQRLERNILLQLDAGLSQCEECEALSEIDWCVSDDTVVRPDIIIAFGVLGERLSITPALIVEIISPLTARRDELLKFDLYQREGVEWYILVYPDENKAKVYRLVEGQYMKEADFSTEAFEFDIGLCSVLLEFSRIW
jgi:Uma2 family endonuclease